MPLGMEVGLGPGHTVLDGDPAAPKGHSSPLPSSIFDPCLLWPTAGWINMPLGTEVDLGPGHIVLYGDPVPLCQKGRSPQFSADVCFGQTLDGSICHLVQR